MRTRLLVLSLSLSLSRSQSLLVPGGPLVCAAAQSLAAALSALEGGSPDGAAPVVAAEAVPM